MLTNEEKEYNINNFYIGELTLTSNNHKEDEFLKLFESDAILLENKTICDAEEWSKKTKQIKVLTIFYYINNNYLCLHNNKSYTKDEINISDDLSSFLPKISFKIPTTISIPKVLSTFNNLFQPKISLNEIYNDQKHKVADLYLGTLVLPTDFIPLNKQKDHKHLNQPINYILSKSTKIRKTSSKSITEETTNPLSLPLGRYIHSYYKCLFLKLPNNQGYYNINNFQIYNKEIPLNLPSQEKPIGESYCENLIPLIEISDKQQLGNKVSLKKVLSKT